MEEEGRFPCPKSQSDQTIHQAQTNEYEIHIFDIANLKVKYEDEEMQEVQFIHLQGSVS